MNKIPDLIMDDEGYPTEEWLTFIEEYQPDEYLPIYDFLELLKSSWNHSQWGFKLHRIYRGIRKLELHTGGWSGNESIIKAIEKNIFLTYISMKYKMWETGGHYYFEIKLIKNKNHENKHSINRS